MDATNQPLDTKNYNDEVKAQPGSVGVEISEEELSKTIKEREASCKPYYEKLKSIADKNRLYYGGDQVKTERLLVGENPTVINKILPAIETIIPLVTEKAPEPDVTVTPLNRTNLILQEKLEKHLHDLWSRDLDMQIKLEHGVRNLAANRYMVVKTFYDTEKKCINTKVLPAGRVLFPEDATCVEDLTYIIEYVPYTLGALIERFPEKEKEIKEAASFGSNVGLESTLITIEYWQSNLVAWKFKDVMLGFDANPYWNWEGDPKFESIGNHLKSPQMPYFFTNIYNFGDSIVDDVSMIDVIISPQDNVNKRKRQIDLNADMANGKYIVAGNKISKESANKISNEPKEIIYLDSADSTNGALDILTGRAYDPGIYNDMQDTKNEIDNIIGTHSTTRGERFSQETARGREILKSGDISRQRTIVRAFEKLARDLYDYWIQLIYVFYDEKRPLHPAGDQRSKVFSSQEALQYISNGEFEKDINIEVQVIDGSIVPKDKDAEKAEAMDLARNQMMSLLDMYRILEYPDPERMARNAVMEQIDPMYLYNEAGKGENLDFEAIRNLLAIQYNNTDQPLAIEYFVDDVKAMVRYLETLTEYLRGEEIHKELLPYDSLTFDAQAEVVEHYRNQKELVNQILNQQAMQSGGTPSEDPYGDMQQPQQPQQPPVAPPPSQPGLAPLKPLI